MSAILMKIHFSERKCLLIISIRLIIIMRELPHWGFCMACVACLHIICRICVVRQVPDED